MTEYTAWGVDYADGKGLTTAEMKANGVQFVCRYLSGGGAKDIDQEELSILLGASIAVVLNWETWGQMPSEAQGVADATAARQEAAGLGLGDAPIYFSADFDPTGKTAYHRRLHARRRFRHWPGAHRSLRGACRDSSVL